MFLFLAVIVQIDHYLQEGHRDKTVLHTFHLNRVTYETIAWTYSIIGTSQSVKVADKNDKNYDRLWEIGEIF
jgi:hypothetical protein